LPLSFRRYTSDVLATPVPCIGDDVRGIDVRLSARRRHIDVVVFRVADDLQPPTLHVQLQDVVTPLAAKFDDFADYTTRVALEVCDEAAPLIYQGVPVWQRAGRRWELAAGPREPGLLVQAG
jgi:hypothetical protein